jgi:DNA-binding helix-hairpin-helix protein with protein kinase domain
VQHWLTHRFRSTAIRDNPEDKTKYTLIYTNKSEKDILLREEFDKLAKQNPEKVCTSLAQRDRARADFFVSSPVQHHLRRRQALKQGLPGLHRLRDTRAPLQALPGTSQGRVYQDLCLRAPAPGRGHLGWKGTQGKPG